MTMAPRRKKSIQPLDECIKRVETLPGFPAMPPKQAAEVYVSCLAMMHHLAADEARFRKRHEKNDTSFPKPNEIPAMSAVIHNQGLFNALISCLQSTTTECPDAASFLSSTAHNSLHTTPGTRKRHPSIDLSHTVVDGLVNKSAKLAHGQSPHTGKRTLGNHVRTHSVQGQQQYQQSHLPQMNIRNTAATILYVVLERFDHWPVPLIEAYAEDCFGGRTWVDDPMCQPLVDNLKLAHVVDGEKKIDGASDEETNINLEAQALIVAEFYQTQKESQQTNAASSNAQQLSPKGQDEARRRGSLSSTTSTELNGGMPMAPSLTRNRSSSFGSESAVSQPRSASPSTSPQSTRRQTPSKPPATLKTKSLTSGGESDSGDEEEIAIASSLSRPSDNGDVCSSSSGEDEEVFMEEMSVDGSELGAGEISPEQAFVPGSDRPPPVLKLTYPLQPQAFKLAHVRQRYFGFNLESARDAITEKLHARLDIKSKQNSGLLQCLPSFTSIPGVRSLITANLEKWLQSPALSGLARNLFSITVNSMENVDPPIQADLDTLDNILSMKLKANQLNAHIENVTAVAKRIPSSAVVNHIYGHLLREILQSMDSHESSFSDHFAMVHAVNDVLPKHLQADGIATSLLGLLTKPPATVKHLSKSQLVKRLNSLIRAISKKFGKSFDCHEVLNAILSYQVNPDFSWTIQDEENKARLLFQCAVLLVDPASMAERVIPRGKTVKVVGPPEEDILSVKANLRKCRMLLLDWCCNEYATILCDLSTRNAENPTLITKGRIKKDEITGAGRANYDSILDGISGEGTSSWMKLIRCVLFMERSESPTLLNFLNPDGTSPENDPDWQEESKRINLCCDLGADLYDDMVWLVLKSCTKTTRPMLHEMGLIVLEHLFDCCSKDRSPQLHLNDPNLLWKLYELVEYRPTIKMPKNGSGDSQLEDATKIDTVADNCDDKSRTNIPLLAYAGMWWRATGIALIMCGVSPVTIGAVAWDQHPTLKALIKMVTSDRYRFPTVDCDDQAREEQKRTEQLMRDDEAKIAEMLFLPPKRPKMGESIEFDAAHQGSRVSKRQQEIREKMRRKEREKERLEEQAESSRRKKMLRAAQKSIVILDPRKGPRKPPKESVDLIFSVGEAFDLRKVFQKNTDPDFVLATIGSTSRSAIERAYDWLIPIISFLPETISRLPASASCFLLLRAYGTRGEERSQLQKLSAPLLQHVHDSLVGKFGEADAVRAFELLLTDMASHKSDRRRCARRVLQNALGGENLGEVDELFAETSHAWVSNLIHVQHVNSILVDSVKKLATAASFERGSNLRYLILALYKLISFAKQSQQPGDWDFARLLMDLVSRRPAVLASTMSSFSDLCSLAIETIFHAFLANIKDLDRKSISHSAVTVEITLCCDPFDSEKEEGIKAIMPLSLLQASCVILSIWFAKEDNRKDTVAIEGLARMLMRSPGNDAMAIETSSEQNDGLASAKIADTHHHAVSVESWVMLAKSRSDNIAKRSALTAPTAFLPRLLLCCGLPRASLLTMVDRLGRLGENADDTNKVYDQLLVPSASSEWDIGRLGHRREIARKLLGRISAYSRMYGLSDLTSEELISLEFVRWLSEACQPTEKPGRTKPKKPKAQPSKIFASLENAGQLLENIPQDPLDDVEASSMTQIDGDTSNMTTFLGFENSSAFQVPTDLSDMNAIQAFLLQVFEDNMPTILEGWLENNFAPFINPPTRKRRRDISSVAANISGEELSFLLLQRYIQLERKVEGLASTLVSWVPRLCLANGLPKLWKVLFAEGQKPSFVWDNLVSRCSQIWDHSHIVKCRLWLLSDGRNKKLDLSKVVRFLIHASTFMGAQIESFADIPVANEDAAWGRSEDTVRSATVFALDCLVSTDCEKRLLLRNGIPDCLLLLILIGRLGRKQVQFVATNMMERLRNENEQTRKKLSLSLLRLYTCFPFSLNLGMAALRANLTETVEEYADEWLSWRSAFDDSLQDMVNSVVCYNSSSRSAQSMIDSAKKHPLLLLRKLDRIISQLETDAFVHGQSPGTEKGGFIVGHTLGGPLEAKVGGKLMKIDVKHWGYNYTEQCWMIVLDVLSAIPSEVLFGCGIKMGLADLLNVYLRLFYVQSQLRTSDRLSKLKDHFSEFLAIFKSHGTEAWDLWLASSITECSSLGANRNLLLSCGFISHEEAMQSVKKAHQRP